MEHVWEKSTNTEEWSSTTRIDGLGTLELSVYRPAPNQFHWGILDDNEEHLATGIAMSLHQADAQVSEALTELEEE